MAEEEKKQEVDKGIFAADEIIPDVVDKEPENILSIEFSKDKDVFPVKKPGDEMILGFDSFIHSLSDIRVTYNMMI